MIVDFHSHTYESDGSLAPQELADFMRERRVRAFSVSDHDTLAAYGKFEPPPGATVVTGIEINTTHRHNAVHILGYRLPTGDPAFEALLERNRAARRARIERIVYQLRAAGYGLELEDVLREAGGQSLGRPHVGRALMRKGLFDDIEATFRVLLRRGRPGYVAASHITPFEAIDAIHAAGGVAVLAHPGRLMDRSIVDELAQRGLDGLETFYPQHSAEEVAAFRDAARHYGLISSAGMDFHDIRYHTAGVGIDVDDDDILPFLRAVGAA